MYNNTFFARMKKQYLSLKTEFKKLPEKERKRKFFEFGMISGIVFLICAYFSGSIIYWFLYMLNPNIQLKGKIYYGIFGLGGLGFIGTLILCGMVLLLFLSIIFRRGINNGILVTDERGVSIMMNGEKGTARYVNEEETKREFNVSDILDTDQIVYGQLTEDGTQVVS